MTGKIVGKCVMCQQTSVIPGEIVNQFGRSLVVLTDEPCDQCKAGIAERTAQIRAKYQAAVPPCSANWAEYRPRIVSTRDRNGMSLVRGDF